MRLTKEIEMNKIEDFKVGNKALAIDSGQIKFSRWKGPSRIVEIMDVNENTGVIRVFVDDRADYMVLYFSSYPENLIKIESTVIDAIYGENNG